MNAVEIEEAISNLAEQPFDAAEFPYAFLEAFGNKATTIKRLRSSNKSDVDGAVLQHNNIHLVTCAAGEVPQTLEQLHNSPATTRQRAKFILATDGDEFQAEDLSSGETIACAFKDFPNHFGFFLPLAGISTVKQTYICGNPPYLGSTWQDDEQKSDLKAIFDHRTKTWKSLDYVAGWFMKAADYGTHTNAVCTLLNDK